MREFSKWKAAPVRIIVALLLTAALIFAALPAVFSGNTAAAETWPDGAGVTYDYAMGFTAEPGTITKVVYNNTEYTSVPESLGAVNSTAAGMKFAGFSVGGTRVADYDGKGTLTVTNSAFFGAEGATVTLTPEFDYITYTVTYNANMPDGSEWTAPAGSVTSYDIGDGTVALPVPAAEGYTFTGWQMRAVVGGSAQTQIITSLDPTIPQRLDGTSIALEGTWAENTYRLTVVIAGQPDAVYDAAAGTPIGAYMGSFSHPAAPEGEEFVGWRVNGQFVDLATYLMPAENVTVEAVFSTPQVVVPVELRLEGVQNAQTESVSVDPGEYTPAQLAGRLSSSVANREGYTRTSVTWADGSTGQKTITDGLDSEDIKIVCTYTLNTYTVTVRYYYDLNGDNVADDINGDGEPDTVATAVHQSVKYGNNYSVTSPAVSGLKPIQAAVSGTATGDTVIEVFYTTAPEKRTAMAAGIGGTVQNDEGGLLDTAVTVLWDADAAQAHSAIAASTGREACGVLSIDMVSAENAVFGVRGTYTVTVDLGDAMSGMDSYIVYKINDDGSYAPIQVRMDGSKLQLTVDSAGDYFVAGVPVPQDLTLLWVVIALLIFIILLAIILLLLLLVFAKKSVTLVSGDESGKNVVIKAKKGSVIELPVPEEREGLVFAGWYLDEECTQPVPLEPEQEDEDSVTEEPEAEETATEEANPEEGAEEPASEEANPEEGAEEPASEEDKPEESAAEEPAAEEGASEEVKPEEGAEEPATEEVNPEEEVKPEESASEEAKPEEEVKPEEDIRIFDEPDGKDVTDEQQGGGEGNAMSSKRARKAKKNKKDEKKQEVPPAEESAKEESAEEESAEEESAEEEPAVEELVVEEVAVTEDGETDEFLIAAAVAEDAEIESGTTDFPNAEEPAESAQEEPAEQPAESAEQPAESAEQPAESAEQPAESAEQPAEPEEQSAESAEPAGECAESADEGAEQAEAPVPVLPEVMRYKVTGSVKLYARWVEKPPEEHIIGFIAGGYVAAVLHTMGKEVLELPAAHELEGYQFAGWFLTEEGRDKPFTADAYADKYLYRDFVVYGQYDKLPEPVAEPVAEPEPEPVVPHVIYFIADGEVIATVETAGRDALDLPAAPVREGYRFRGWFTDEDTHENAVEESSFVDKDLEEDINVYAFYEEEKEEEPEEEEVAAAVLPEEDEDEAEEEAEEEEEETTEVEEKEDDEEEEPEEDGAPRLITAEDARKRRTSTMRGRLRYGSDVNKTIYEELVNHLLTYKNVTRSLTNRADNFKHKGSLMAKITLTGKTIKLFLPLDPEAYEYDKYHQLITEKKGYEEVPFTLKVKSNRGLKYAKELIDEAMAQKQVDKKKKSERKSFKELIMLQKGSLLIKAKKTDKLRSRVDSQDANAQLTDAEALELIRIKNVPYTDEVKKTAFVGLDKIQDLYNDCDMVNIRTLRKRGLVKEEHNRVKIIGGGTLTKSLRVYADEYSLTAVKMIVLLGGKVVKLVEETLEPENTEQ